MKAQLYGNRRSAAEAAPSFSMQSMSYALGGFPIADIDMPFRAWRSQKLKILESAIRLTAELLTDASELLPP